MMPSIDQRSGWRATRSSFLKFFILAGGLSIAIAAPDPRTQETKIGGMSKAVAKSWWAFQPLPKADPDPTSAKIDAFLNSKLMERSMTPVGKADGRTLIRRSTYDLTGLPPTPGDVEAFLADRSPNAFAKVVERLLASPQYGVRWGRHWLDVVRYADTAGENTDRPLPHAWRYRNWVFDAFNRDLPFDEFVRLQLAGDLIRGSEGDAQRNEGIVATGYLAIARRFGHDIDKDVHLMHEDVIDNLGKNFLGLTTGCARCHDHKYDPVTAEDYYALYGIFASTRFAFPGCEPKGQPRDLVPLMSSAKVDALMKPWRDKVAAAEQDKKNLAESVKDAKKIVADAMSGRSKVLAEAKVGEGKSVSFGDVASANIEKLKISRGDILQLTVLPNANHGADTTLVEWTVAEAGAGKRRWSLSDLVATLLESNPHSVSHGATWCFYEATAGPAFLTDRQKAIDGNPALQKWSVGDLPSVFVNSSEQEVKVWTKLPPKTFFVHPAHNRPVAMAWVSPFDGVINLKGRVADAHPTGLDGVAFRLEHIAAPDAGPALIAIGRAMPSSLKQVGPEPVIPVAYAVVDANPKNVRLHERGDPELLGNEVPRRWISIFGGAAVPNEAGSGRRELGDWIAGHPLTARVMVNRIWQWHFGRGIVATPNDFGSRGEAPTDPGLLDWLAAQFVASGHRVKDLHRLIMGTTAYQRSSTRPAAIVEADPDNRLIGRFSRRRLTAEEIRDSLLAVSGQLDAAPAEAHPFPQEKTWKFTQHNPFNAVYETKKRSAYLMVQRQRRHPFLALFDGADPNASTPTRQMTTMPTQALYFLNAPFFHEQAAAFADGLMKLPDDESRIARAFRVLFQRTATPAEVTAAKTFLSRYPADARGRWLAYARVLLAANEFVHVD